MQQQIQSEDNISLSENVLNVEKPIIRIDSKFASDSVSDLTQDLKNEKTVEDAFMEKRNLLLSLINGTKTLLTNMRANRNNWPVQYPIKDHNEKETKDRSVDTDSIKKGLEDNIVNFDDDNLEVLRLNLKVENYADSMATAWDNAIIAHLDSKILESTRHLEKLYMRISDTSSKVLITGDLNAGKSTFVNAVLRKSVVPQDQQPCTAGFCEVIDAKNNDGIEEVHAIDDPETYNREDPSTFTRFQLDHLKEVITENAHQYSLFKIYCNDDRTEEESLLNNGVVDISLIDSPGLNIDSLKTTALFAQQEEIDVIVFMVNAENHFTLSGKQFLQNAGKEKGYIFIVINRFDQIEEPERCKRDILSQIEKISPKTYEDSDNLVHFVSAKKTLLEHKKGNHGTKEFDNLEQCLRTFILEKRSKSKLNPAKVYLENVLKDIKYISEYNKQLEMDKIRAIQEKIDGEMPNYYNLKSVKEEVSDDIDKIIDSTSSKVQAYTKDYLSRFVKDLERYSLEVEYNGFIYAWSYANELRNHLYQLAAKRARYCAKYGQKSAAECIEHVKNMIKDVEIDESITAVLDQANVDSIMGDEEFLAPKLNGEVGSNKNIIKAISLEFSDFFDLQDQLEIVKDYLPSFAMLASGIYGYHKLAGQLISVGNRIGIENIAKAAFVALGIAGLGSLTFALSNMKYTIEHKVTQKVRNHLRTIEYVDNNVDRISKNTRRSLRVVLWDFHNQFSKTFESTIKKREEYEHEQRMAEDAKEFFASLSKRSEELKKMVSTIDLENAPKSKSH
ncbi:P-loop containing nucleoside triphosphate hydrolase protein [Neocallimastix lanati (nom. inval.)]|nr:P-loop containing nucleoside triphosphate hydrolase protein [Neocallimastix sp. JGI-2020a]